MGASPERTLAGIALVVLSFVGCADETPPRTAVTTTEAVEPDQRNATTQPTRAQVEPAPPTSPCIDYRLDDRYGADSDPYEVCPPEADFTEPEYSEDESEYEDYVRENYGDGSEPDENPEAPYPYYGP